MKCPNCNGQRYKAPDVPCGRCCGKGVVEPMTEQEYIQSCNTEQLAETIAQYFYGWTTNSTPYDIILHSVVEWLKQPHTPKE